MLPLAGVGLAAANLAVLARGGSPATHGSAMNCAVVLAPLIVVLAVSTRSIREALACRFGCRGAALFAWMGGALYLTGASVLNPAANGPAAWLVLRNLVLVGLPFALFWWPGTKSANAIGPRDMGFTAAVFALSGLRAAHTPVPIGLRGGMPYQTDASNFLWLAVLVWYLVLVRRLDDGYSLHLGKRDAAWFVTTYLWLMALLLPLAMVTGFIPLQPVAKTGEQILFALSFYIFRVALSEEVVFRLVLQNFLVRLARQRWGEGRGDLIGVAAASLVFGLAHVGKGSPIFVVLAFIAGLGYGLAFHLSGRLTAPVLIHGAVDVTHIMFR